MYGEADPTLTYIITSGSLLGTDRLNGEIPRAPGEDVGAYAIGQGSLANPNYAITFVPGVFTITAGPASIANGGETGDDAEDDGEDDEHTESV